MRVRLTMALKKNTEFVRTVFHAGVVSSDAFTEWEFDMLDGIKDMQCELTVKLANTTITSGGGVARHIKFGDRFSLFFNNWWNSLPKPRCRRCNGSMTSCSV